MMEGYGIYHWIDGSSYEGEYKASLKDGRGKYIYPDGRIYEGEWRAGVKHG